MSVLIMLTISFPEALLMTYLAIQFMGGRPRLTEVILIAMIQAIVAYIVRSLPIPVGSHTVLLALSYITLLVIIARLPYWGAAIGIITGFVFLIILEIFVIQLMLNVAGITLQSIIIDPYKRIMVFVPIAGMMLIMILVFKKYDITFHRIIRWRVPENKYPAYADTGNKEYLPAVIFIFLPIFLLFILNFTYVSVEIDVAGSYPDLFKAFFNALIVILTFVSIWALRKINKAVEKEYEAARATETINQLKELIFSIRKQRHDFNHQLQAVYGLIETGSHEKARDYIRKTYNYVSGTGELIKTDNPAISALLYTKIGIAETRNIRFDINIECSLEEFPLNGNEASSLLGNLVDNAFDAVEKNEAGKRVVRFGIAAVRGEYVVEVANPGELDKHISERIFEASFTTKEGHAGLGLAIVRELAEKYKGNTQVISGSGETSLRVSIPRRR